MPRPTWKGSISFGLVHIPVALYPGESRNELSFRMLDSRNNARVRYQRVNDVTGEEVPWDQIVKAYEYDDENYVVLTDEDFERVAVEVTKTVEIEDFVDRSEIDLRYYDKPYILEPAKNGEKGYVLLREALKQTGKAGIAKVVIRTRQYLSVLIAQDEALMLIVLRFADELRSLDQFKLPSEDLSDHKVSQKEVDMAKQLVDAMGAKWEPDRYHDEYREALLAWIEKKAAGGGRVAGPGDEEEAAPPAAEITNVIDLLKRSVKASEGKRDGKKKSAGSKGNGGESKSKANPKKKAR